MSPPTPGSSILMISAPRSASTWVPKGPAPNWETARMGTPASGGFAMSVGKLAGAEGGVALLRHENHAGVGADLLAALVARGGLHGDDATIALLRLAQLEDAALCVEGVTDEGGFLVLEGIHLEVGDGPSGDVRHRHADDHTVDEGAQDHALLVLGVGLGVVSVGVERVLVHGQEGEPRAVGLGDGAPRPMPEHLTHRELLEVASVAHGAPVLRRLASAAWRAIAWRISSPPGPLASSMAASR